MEMREIMNLVEDETTDEPMPSLELLKWAEANIPAGVEMRLDVPEYGGHYDGETIDIQWFERKDAAKGVPTGFLEALCQMADELSVEIRLGVQKNRRYQKLVRYYAGMGFEPSDSNWDDDEFVNMKREPEGADDGADYSWLSLR